MPPSGTRKTTILNRRAGQKARLHYWLKRCLFVAAGVAIVGGGIVYATTSGYVGQMEGRMTRSLHATMAENGFAVKNLLVEGRINTSRDGLRTLLDVTKGQSIFEPDLGEMQHRLEQITWVRHAVVERHLPDTLAIRLEERRPLALWQRQNKLSVIDTEGVVLTDNNIGKFKDLLIVVGEKAPQYAYELVAMIEAEPDLAKRVESAKWIGGRRWDLHLKNGVSVKLPEEDIGQAVRRLAKAQGEANLMDRKVQSIDLRDPVRIVVQTEPGAAEEYQASYKKEKNI